MTDSVDRQVEAALTRWLAEGSTRLPDRERVLAVVRSRLTVTRGRRSVVKLHDRWARDGSTARAEMAAAAVGPVSSVGPVETVGWRTIPLGRPTIAFLVGAFLLMLATGLSIVLVGADRQAAHRPGAASDGAGLPPLVGPAGNGLIAFSRDGDIMLGDPLTGTSEVIVGGPALDSEPVFSPDGTRIAFLRGPIDQGGFHGPGSSLVVVAVDGSDGRVIVPADFSQRGLGVFAWTPDGTGLVVNHDADPARTPYFDGLLSLFDANGVAAPRLLTPPLRAWPGGPYFAPNAVVAPPFRPPDGEQMLSDGAGISLIDLDGSDEQVLVSGDWLAEQRFSYVLGPTWSPDGSRIAFTAGPAELLHVMKADGSGIERLGGDGVGGVDWSPDGSLLAFVRRDSDPGRVEVALIVLNMATGAERVMRSAVAGRGAEGTLPDYFTWRWSPDGQSLLVVDESGAQPWLIDAESGEMTVLPWAADRTASWQRVGTS